MLSLRLYHSKHGTSLRPAPGPACDQCRRKKAKCNRQQPCQTCKRGQTACSYDAIPKARGRRPRFRFRAEASDSPRSISTWNNITWETGAPGQTTDATLDVLCNDSTITQPRGLDDRSDITSVPALDPVFIEEYNTPQDFGEGDTSSDGTRPAVSQRHSALESCLSEDVSAPSYHQLVDESDSGLWASSEGVADFYQTSIFMLPRSTFLPYVYVFFQRLYPVFPVVGRETLLALLELDEHEGQPLPASLYSFLAALSAAIIVQLNVTDLSHAEKQKSTLDESDDDSGLIFDFRPPVSAQFFISQCLQVRQQLNFIEEPDEWTILTSFFLFAYHGNLEQSRSAWYYLREAIGFAQTLRLDEADTYISLDKETAQRYRRLFWLLFITERAYAIQQRKRTVLRPTIHLPRESESQGSKLAYGFVTLAKVFAAIDEAFINAWMDQPPSGTVDDSQKASQSVSKFLRHNDVEGVLSEIEETQRLDILITHHWLRVLVCQLQIGTSPKSIPAADRSNTHCVLDTSRQLLQIISTASSISLEPHGIGMEQKVSDVASCLCDILAGLSANEFSIDFSSAPDLLHNFMVFLAGFRNHESHYLRPLAQKATTVLAARLHPTSFSANVEENVIGQEVLNHEKERMWRKV